MSVGVEALFPSALGLGTPWEVAKVDLDMDKRRIDFEVRCNAKLLSYALTTAVLWAKEHWHIAAFVCVCLPMVGAVLFDLGVVTVRGALAATVAAIAYVLITTWNFTHDRGDDNKHNAD